jgi:DNA-binding MarR family transcriptional regulator
MKSRTILAALQATLNRFREVDKDMPITTVMVFAAVAAYPDKSAAFYADITGLGQSSISRNLQALGAQHRTGKPGYKLIEVYPDPEETRRYLARPSTQGRRLADVVEGFFS